MKNREITKTIARLRARDFAGMRINANGTRSYRTFNNCPEEELILKRVISCPAILTNL